jgi:hypothetical protein
MRTRIRTRYQTCKELKTREILLILVPGSRGLICAIGRASASNSIPAARLRAGALALLHTPRYSHPCYSAGFALVGDAN